VNSTNAREVFNELLEKLDIWENTPLFS